MNEDQSVRAASEALAKLQRIEPFKHYIPCHPAITKMLRGSSLFYILTESITVIITFFWCRPAMESASTGLVCFSFPQKKKDKVSVSE